MDSYPIVFELDYPEQLSRWRWLVKWLLAIPHFIIVGAYQYLAGALVLVSIFAILFTGRYPRGLFDLVAGYARWSARVSVYPFLRDEYPPFTIGDAPDYPARLRIEYPERLSRGMWLVKWLLAIPHFVVLYFYAIAVLFALLIALFTIVFTGRIPRGLFEFMAGLYRWQYRVMAYALLMLTDEYPPFSNGPATREATAS